MKKAEDETIRDKLLFIVYMTIQLYAAENIHL